LKAEAFSFQKIQEMVISTMEHEFGPWEQIKSVKIGSPAHKKDIGEDSEADLQAQRNRRLNNGIDAKNELDCEHTKYGRLYNSNYRTLRIKNLSHTFSDGVDG
jgi:hypothetical protein